MNHDNIEKQLAEKLGSRSIQPSAGSWERVAFARQQPAKKSNHRFIWKGVAAAILVVVGTLHFANSSRKGIAPARPEPIVYSDRPANTNPAPGETAGAVSHSVPKKTDAVVQMGAATPQPTVILPANNLSPAETTAEKPGVPPVYDELVLLKSEAIAAELQRRVETNQPVTDAVVDSLLRKAQREIAMERLHDAGGNKPADANALLKEAETEVDRTFRENTINLFKSKFRTIRIALH